MPKDYVIGPKTKLVEKVRDKNGVLFEVDPERQYDQNATNIIYINGSQLDHFNKNGKTIFNPCAGNTRYGHVGDWYSDNLKPYIFKYIVDDDYDDSSDFTFSLENLLEVLDTDKNIVVGKSYGGIIAGISAQSDLVQEAHLVNPSILGSSLSDLKLIKDNCHNFTDLLIYLGCLHILEPERCFTYENYMGVYIENSPKIHIYGGSVNDLEPTTVMERVMKLGADKIYELSGELSDGMAIWKEDYYKKRGFDYTLMDRPYHYKSNEADYMYKIYSKRIKR